MSKKISFSSVIKAKSTSHDPLPSALPSLVSLLQEYQYNPNANFVLSLAPQNSRKVNHNPSRRQINTMQFQEGVNPLQEWINNQSSQSQLNKQNSISNQQYGRQSSMKQSPLKAIKSPRKNYQCQDYQKMENQNHKTSFSNAAISKNRNLSMNQLSKIYVENKQSMDLKPHSRRSDREPVWKFGSKQSQEDSYTPEQQQYEQSNAKTINTNNSHQVNNHMTRFKSNPKTDEDSTSIKRQQNHKDMNDKEESQDINLEGCISKIKESISQQIEMLANHMIENRQKEKNKSLKDQELLISQRQTENEKGKLLEIAQRQVNQYLKIKNEHCSSNPQSSQMHSDNSGVGYSFASQFNSKIISNINPPVDNTQEKQDEEQLKTDKFDLKASQQPKFRLPNIDQVRSEHDYNDAAQRYKLQQEQEIESHHNNNPTRNIEIDSQYIKEIQSVAYHANQPEERPYSETHPIREITETQINSPNQEHKSSLNQRVNKLSISLSDAQVPNQNVKNSETKQLYIPNSQPEHQEKITTYECQQRYDNHHGIGFYQKQHTKIQTKCEGTYKQVIYHKQFQSHQTEQKSSMNTMGIKNDLAQKSSPLAIKHTNVESKTSPFAPHEAKQNSINSKESLSENKRLIKLTLSPKYQQSQQNNVVVTNFGDQEPSRLQKKVSQQNVQSINAINSSGSNHIKLESYFGNKKIDRSVQDSIVDKEPMIKYKGVESRELKKSLKGEEGRGVNESNSGKWQGESFKAGGKGGVNASGNSDKFQFDLDF